MRSRFVLLGIALVLLLPLAPTAANSPARTMLMVRFQPAVTLAEASRLVRSVGATVNGRIPQLDLLSISLPNTRADAAFTQLMQQEAVIYAEPNARAWATLLPNDPGWLQQWGPQKINAPQAWDLTMGSPDQVIAILDSGVTINHPDLTNQLWVNPGEVPANGIDDDANGKVDDVWGWHFYHNWDGETYVPAEDNQVADDYGHGTHVAGIAGAEINNGTGVAGMAGDSKLMTVKVLDQYGIGWYDDIAQGIVYAVDNGAQVINLSLGGTASSQALQDAVNYALAHNVLVVASTGNDGGAVLYPAACDNVLAVAATDRDDQRPSFSNYGPQVDVAAPGVDIYSTWPWRDGYWTESGTSMSAPHVAGVAALIWATQPLSTAAQISYVITSTAHDIQTPGWDPYTGWGRVDAWAAVHRWRCHSYLPIISANQ